MENKVEEEVKTEVSENKIEPINQSAEDKKKAKKKKNKKKKETSQQEEKKNSEGSSNQTQEIEEDPQKQYEKELQWCINQIKTGMSSNKLDQLQLKESKQVLAILESETAPLIRKRHLMSVIFGDYRKLMKK